MNAEDDWLAPLQAKFFAALPAHREALLHLHAQADRDGLIERAHKLAGLAGMLGAPKVGEAALLFEEALRGQQLTDDTLAALVGAIDQAIG